MWAKCLSLCSVITVHCTSTPISESLKNVYNTTMAECILQSNINSMFTCLYCCVGPQLNGNNSSQVVGSSKVDSQVGLTIRMIVAVNNSSQVVVSRQLEWFINTQIVFVGRLMDHFDCFLLVRCSLHVFMFVASQQHKWKVGDSSYFVHFHFRGGSSMR